MGWNGNNFSVYDNDELSMLELLEVLGGQTNFNTEGLNSKTDLYGDHKGTWQGYRPTQVEPGFSAVLDSHDKKLNDMVTLVTSFYIDLETHASDMIDRALSSSPTYKNVVLPKGEYTTIKPIIIPPGCSFNGVGGETVIKPDFSRWVGTDYRVVIIKGREGINTDYKCYNTKVGNFSISGVNSASVKATGVFVGTDQNISSLVAVNYSFTDGLIENIYVEKVDTAFKIKECWNSDIVNITGMYCRKGIELVGKSVNLNILCKLTNFSNLYTNDVTATRAVEVDSKLDYSNGEGRPEGILFKEGCLIFGAATDLFLNRCLFLTFHKCIVDGATGDCVIIGDVDNVTLDTCYLYTSGLTSSIIVLNATTSYNKTTIRNCRLTGSGSGGSTNGLYSFAGNRKGLEFVGNDIVACLAPIKLNYCNEAIIKDNHGHDNYGTFIYCQSACDYTIIDGNNSKDSFAIISGHATTNANLDIRNNWSANSNTYKTGRLKLLTGTTSISTTGGVFGTILNTGNLIYPFVKFSADSTADIKVTQANNVITFTIDSNATSDIAISYEVFARTSLWYTTL